MRIAFFGQSGPFSPPALRVLVERPRSFTIAMVVEGRRRAVARGHHKWIPGRRRPLPQGDDLAELASAAGIDALLSSDVNGGTVAGELRRRRVDAICCVGFDRLFGATLLAAAPAFRINAHPSALPYLRGPSPIYWLLRRGHRESVLTWHEMDRHEDHGAILAQEHFTWPADAGGDAIYSIAGRKAGEMLVNVLDNWKDALAGGQPQDHARALRAPRPRAEDALIVPQEWGAADLMAFCCGSAYFRTPWVRFSDVADVVTGDTGDVIFHIRRGLKTKLGATLPGQFVLQGSTLFVECRDGVVALEVQT